MSTSLSAFDDEYEEDGRESQSSSDLDSRDGDLGTSNRPPSLTFNAYLTPDARSTTGSVAPRAKEKLARLCGGRKCIVTHELAPHAGIEVAHLLPRSTGATQLAKLEFAFGLRYRQIHIDTTGNLEHIKSDLHRSFDHMGWFLLPELHVIQNILQFTLAPAGRTYKEVFPPAERFKYRLVPLQLIKDNIGIWRRKSSDPLVPLDTPDPSNPFPPPPAYDQIYPIGLSPPPVFESLPILESRANPFFVVANAGPKLQAGMTLLPSSWISRVDIMTVNTIWTLWMMAMVAARRGSKAPHGAMTARRFPGATRLGAEQVLEVLDPPVTGWRAPQRTFQSWIVIIKVLALSPISSRTMHSGLWSLWIGPSFSENGFKKIIG
ncbi:hypothetical protein GGX14DRAFT_580302 [Mycena pura]|uniref:HNH nuclease domain-containing protein n=1 Tax=Mycena pura TaxID=153505 RepID=A0AAD6Y1A3_9AGAR|nr:hypothetical protein GGX14DRAFT_580302 [Mycena pura]